MPREEQPEFARNLWLEFTPHRLVAVPAIVAALVFLGVRCSTTATARTLELFAAFGCGGLLGIWGSRLAAGSIADEAANRTWDGQRLSALTPWEMTWGKLAGSTAVAWYGGLLCLGVYASASAGTAHPEASGDVGRRPRRRGGALPGGVVPRGAHRVAPRACLHQPLPGGGGMVFALLLYWSLVSNLLVPGKAASGPTVWFGHAFPADEFLLASLALFAAWAVAGAWRLMREELQVQAPPWSGWRSPASSWPTFPDSGTAACRRRRPCSTRVGGRGAAGRRVPLGLALLYIAALFEPKDPVVFRRLVTRWRTGGAAAAFDVLPCWLATVPLLLLTGAAAAAVSAVSGPASSGPLGHPALFVVSCLGFVLRDIALLLGVQPRTQPEAGGCRRAVYWVLLYGVVPTILRQLDIRGHAVSLYPTGAGRPRLSRRRPRPRVCCCCADPAGAARSPERRLTPFSRRAGWIAPTFVVSFPGALSRRRRGGSRRLPRRRRCPSSGFMHDAASGSTPPRR